MLLCYVSKNIKWTWLKLMKCGNDQIFYLKNYIYSLLCNCQTDPYIEHCLYIPGTTTHTISTAYMKLSCWPIHWALLTCNCHTDPYIEHCSYVTAKMIFAWSPGCIRIKCCNTFRKFQAFQLLKMLQFFYLLGISCNAMSTAHVTIYWQKWLFSTQYKYSLLCSCHPGTTIGTLPHVVGQLRERMNLCSKLFLLNLVIKKHWNIKARSEIQRNFSVVKRNFTSQAKIIPRLNSSFAENSTWLKIFTSAMYFPIVFFTHSFHIQVLLFLKQ